MFKKMLVVISLMLFVVSCGDDGVTGSGGGSGGVTGSGGGSGSPTGEIGVPTLSTVDDEEDDQ